MIVGGLLSDARQRGMARPFIAGADNWIWQRIEAYTIHRCTVRNVVWTVEGPGDWVPPLTPATVASVEIWHGNSWEVAFPSASPYGGFTLACEGTYRFTGTAGGGDVPAAMMQAAVRLSNYLLAGVDLTKPDLWATSVSNKAGGESGGETTFQRPATWIAKALQNSGAADLLRPYRRAP